MWSPIQVRIISADVSGAVKVYGTCAGGARRGSRGPGLGSTVARVMDRKIALCRADKFRSLTTACSAGVRFGLAGRSFCFSRRRCRVVPSLWRLPHSAWRRAFRALWLRLHPSGGGGAI